MKKWFACALVALSMLATSSCGGDDGYGICDRSMLTGYFDCVEATGDGAGSAKGACEEQGGDWSAGSCPDASLIGFCSYPLFNLDIRQFYYTDPNRTGDPMSACVNTTHNGTPGEWTAP